MTKLSAALSINTLKEIITNIEKRGFGHENIESGIATAVLDFKIEKNGMLSLLNLGEW
jgi:hypothetical protein